MVTIITARGTGMTDQGCVSDIYKLAAWLSPSFPVGAYTYSSGLEYAVEAALITDAASLEDWLAGMFRYGAGTVEGGFFSIAHRAASAGDEDALGDVLEWADAMRPTAELALESTSQGEAFLRTIRKAWPHQGLETLTALARSRGRKPAYAVAVGATCGFHNVSLEPSLMAFLHALAANLVSAAVRTIPLGQTDGQLVTAALAPELSRCVAAVKDSVLDDLGAATSMVDWVSMKHETQYTRLFRS